MKHLLTLILLQFLFTFNSTAQNRKDLPTDWKEISGCSVNIYVPSDIKFDEDALSDSCISKYQSKNILIEINVTPFRIGLDQFSYWSEFCITKTKTNVGLADIVTAKIPSTTRTNGEGDYAAVLLMPQFRKGSNLMIWTWSKSSVEREKAIKILQSVRSELK